MIASHYPVVIVGAGPTGLTAATLLGQYGVDTLVLDRWDEVYPQPRAVHLDDEVYRIVARLGLAEQFAAISRPACGLRLVDRDMRMLAEFPRDPSQSPHGFPQANMFDQPDFECLLRSEMGRYDRVRVHENSEVTQVMHGRDDVRVDYTDRVTGEKQSVRAGYVLGCDGANSIVRSSIGSRMQELGFEQRWLVVDIATEADLMQWEGVHQVCDPIRASTYMRIGRTRYRWEFRLLAGESSADYPDLDAVRPLIAPWMVNAVDADLKLIRVADYIFRAQVADSWRDRRVFLLGDAAHLTPPFIGQGMGAGLRDAANLAWKLAGVLDSTLPDNCLDSYQQERKPHARSIIRTAVGLGWAMTEGGKTGNLLRRHIAPLAQRFPLIGVKVTDSATPPLHSSFFVEPGGAGRGLAGTLCPNPALPDAGGRLDDRMPKGFLVITTVLPAPQQQHEIERRGATVLSVSPDSELGRWLRRGHATVALVRPDRTVLRAGRSLSTLYTLLPTFTCSVDRSLSIEHAPTPARVLKAIPRSLHA